MMNSGSMFSPANYAGIIQVIAEQRPIIEAIEAVNLLGRGGAEGPIAKKWRTFAKQNADKKYIVANGSEGESETAKDHELMLRAPWAIIQGMLLASAATGAKNGIVYVRAEYPECYESMKKAAHDAPLGDFSLEVVHGSGTYVCGEKTAILRAIEGKRGEPALNPAPKAEAGLFGCPVLVNNVESFAAVSQLLLNGTVTKLFTVSGCVENPGVYELGYGVTVRELGELAGVKKPVGFRLGGGYTGRIYNTSSMDMRLDAGAKIGTASVMFFDSSVSVRKLCAESVGILADESCGKCVPCQYGTRELYELLSENGSIEDIRRICAYLKTNSRCTFGANVPNTVESALVAFPKEVEHG